MPNLEINWELVGLIAFFLFGYTPNWEILLNSANSLLYLFDNLLLLLNNTHNTHLYNLNKETKLKNKTNQMKSL